MAYQLRDPLHLAEASRDGRLDLLVARQLLHLVAFITDAADAGWDEPEEGSEYTAADDDASAGDDDGAAAATPIPEDDAAALAEAARALASEPTYLRLSLTRDGVPTHDVLVYPWWNALVFLPGTTTVVATLADDWTADDPELAAALPAALEAAHAEEEARLRARHAAARAARGEPAPVTLTGGPDVGVVTFAPLPAVGLEALDSIDQRRAARCWRFVGEGDGDLASLEELLATDGFRRWDVLGADGATLASWWGGGDCGLLFRGGSAELIGEAIQHGFVCRDHALWRSIGATDTAPGGISWEPPDELIAGGDRLWIAPPDPEALWAALYGEAADE